MRAVLVGGAVVAALVAAALGWWVVTLLLGIAVLAHALMWVWLYQQSKSDGEAEGA